MQVDEVEAWDRGPGHIRLSGLAIDGFGGAAFKIAQKIVEDLLDLIQYEMVYASDLFMVGGGIGASCYHGDAGPVASLDNALQGFPLNDHGRGKHQVRPLQIPLFHGSHVHVHDTEVVFRREHGGYGEQTQRWKGRLDAKNLQRKIHSPVGGRILGIHQKRVRHGTDLLGQCKSGAAFYIEAEWVCWSA